MRHRFDQVGVWGIRPISLPLDSKRIVEVVANRFFK